MNLFRTTTLAFALAFPVALAGCGSATDDSGETSDRLTSPSDAVAASSTKAPWDLQCAIVGMRRDFEEKKLSLEELNAGAPLPDNVLDGMKKLATVSITPWDKEALIAASRDAKPLSRGAAPYGISAHGVTARGGETFSISNAGRLDLRGADLDVVFEGATFTLKIGDASFSGPEVDSNGLSIFSAKKVLGALKVEGASIDVKCTVKAIDIRIANP